jgi:hypothetical protein
MKTFLTKNISILFFISIILFKPLYLKGTHLAGAELSYTCITNNTFNVEFSFYGDCNGSGHPLGVGIIVQSISCNVHFDDTIMVVPDSTQQIFFACQDLPTQCDDTSSLSPGIRKFKYSGVITLPMQCSDWVFSWEYCCRNCDITNLPLPACLAGSGVGMYVSASLDNLNINCNSTPYFTNPPIMFVCVGQTLIYDHGAIDADGDSLVYSLVDPLIDAITPVPFLSGYSATAPIISSPALTIDPFTGDINMTPTQLQVCVLAVLVQEFRNGLLIGHVNRDMQVYVRLTVDINLLNKNEINIFPNPNSTGIINLNQIIPGNFTIYILNVFGEIILRKETFVTAPDNNIQFNLGNIQKGIYVIMIEGSKGKHFQKLILN